jgi:hypothetical protein
MALDVAAARAAVSQAALARDEDALRAIADSLPPLVAYGYERHRARAFANAIRGARDSAVAELCLGVAACAPAAATFVADTAQVRLLIGDIEPEPSTRSARTPATTRLPRLALSGAALAAAVAALAIVPGRLFDEARPEAAGVTVPARTAVPRVVVADRPASSTSPASRTRGDTANVEGAPLLVAAPLTARAGARPASSSPPEPRPPAAAASRRPAKPPAPVVPPPPAEPAAVPAPAPAPAATPTVTVTPTPVAAPAATTTTKGRGKAQAADRLKKRSAPTPPGTVSPPPAHPAQAPQAPADEASPPAEPHANEDPPGHAYGHEKDKNSPKQ